MVQLLSSKPSAPGSLYSALIQRLFPPLKMNISNNHKINIQFILINYVHIILCCADKRLTKYVTVPCVVVCHEVVAWLGTTDRRYPVDKIKDTGRGTLANFDQPRQLDIEVQTNMPRRRVKEYYSSIV